MEVLNMNKELFLESINQEEKPVLVEFWAPWCTYCRRIAPAFKKVVEETEDIIIGQINIDEVPGIAEELNIEVIPTFLFYKGKEVVNSIVAPESKAKIEEFIKESLEK